MAKLKQKGVDSRILIVLVLAALLINGAIFYVGFGRQRTGSQRASERSGPPYFASQQSAQPLPQTLDPSEFSKSVAAAYAAAKEIPAILAQQPCYCYCQRRGHRSLLDCFTTKHGADCDICVKEALFALREHRDGKTPGQIRAEIIQGGWKSIQI